MGRVLAEQRAGVLFRFRELLDGHRDELAAIVTGEHGKVLDDARGEVARGIENVEFACGVPAPPEGRRQRRGLDRASTCTPCTSPSASWPASRRSTSR